MTRQDFLELVALVPPTASVEVFCLCRRDSRGRRWGVYLRSSQPCFPSGLPLGCPIETAHLDGARTHAAIARKLKSYHRWLEQTRMEAQS